MDPENFRVEVTDNGVGIASADFGILAEEYSTRSDVLENGHDVIVSASSEFEISSR